MKKKIRGMISLALCGAMLASGLALGEGAEKVIEIIEIPEMEAVEELTEIPEIVVIEEVIEMPEMPEIEEVVEIPEIEERPEVIEIAEVEEILPAEEIALPAAEEQELPAEETPSEEAADVLPTAFDPTLVQEDYSAENSTRGFVYRMYQTVLGRRPDRDGLNYWVNLLDSGSFTAAAAVNGFFNSAEYQSAGKSNGQIINDLYETLLNRTADQSGYDFWKSRLDIGMTPQSILQGFVESSEFTNLTKQYGLNRGSITLIDPRDFNYDRTYFVYRMYKNALGREPDADGEAYWCANLANGMSGIQMASGFFFSDEFNNHRYDNEEFVKLLYQTILGREADKAGLADWTSKLNYTQTREKVLNGFVGSAEFGTQCVKAEIAAGNPMDTPDDSVAWQANIQVLKLCNDYRRIAGLNDLVTREDLLWDLAMLRAEEIMQRFSHTRPDGTSCFTLFAEEGFYGNLGENLAGGQTSVADVVNAWMNSEGHRANILNSTFTYLATAYLYNPSAATYCTEGKYTGQYVSFKHYWAQSFCNFGIDIN